MPDQNHYENTKSFFDASALHNQGYYDGAPGKLKHNPWQKMIRRIVVKQFQRLFQCDKTLRTMVDIGCGNGDFCFELRRRFSHLTEICGCDFSHDMLDVMRKHLSYGDAISAQPADLLALPFSDGRFDLSLCLNTLHHIHADDLSLAIAELARVARQYVIVEIKNRNNFYKKYLRPQPFDEIKVYPVAPKKIIELFHTNGYKLIDQKNIFFRQFFSPLIVQIYRKIKS